MNSSSRPDALGMRDFYAVYAAHEVELNAYLIEVCRKLPSLATLVAQLTPQQLEAQHVVSRALLEKAVDGTWEPLLEQQRASGTMYAHQGVPFSDWFELVGAFQKVLYPHLVKAYAGEPDRLVRVLTALSAYLDLAMSDIGEEYLKAKERIITHQAEAIRELSTPVLQMRGRLLLIPLVGVLDTHRARRLTDALLTAVREHRARVAVIDLTGVAAVDSKVANHLLQTVAAAELMGAHSIITGLSADVAEALVVLGVDLRRLNTAGDLRSGLEEAEALLAAPLFRGAMPVPILKLGDTLIVSIQASLADAELSQLRSDIAERIGRLSIRGLVLDVSALDVLDSFASRTLIGIVKVSNLRGANAVIVGIQPEVAFAMVQLGLTLEGVDTALDLDEGMALLANLKKRAGLK